MKTKHLFLTSFAVAALITASFSNIFSNGENAKHLNYDEKTFFCPEDTTGQGDGNGGGPKIPPIGN